MAKVVVGEECIDIRVSMLERMVLSERSRKVPLARIRSVDAHPALLDMMVHWADQGSVWLGGVSAYEGHMIPSTRNPRSTLAIDVEDEPRMFVEVDGEPTDVVAERISRAIGSQPPPPSADAAASSVREVASEARVSELALEIVRVQKRRERQEEEEDWLVERQRRDPLGQGGYGSLPPPPLGNDEEDEPAQRLATVPEPAHPLQLHDDRDLKKLGGWLLALGSFAVLTGAVIVAAGAVPGLLAVGAGVICGVFGAVALAVVAHHQG